jgi:hypothetical protein
MDTTQSIRTESNSPIDEMMLERRRAEALVLMAALRAALAVYKQHVNESLERVLKLVDAAEAWGSGGEAPELATRYASTAKACFDGLCSSRGAAGCDCTHCVAAEAIAEFTDLGFSYLQHPALVALGWVTGYGLEKQDSNLESALEGIGEVFAQETDNGHVGDKASEAAYAAANGAARALAARAAVTASGAESRKRRSRHVGARRKRASNASRSAQLHA